MGVIHRPTHKNSTKTKPYTGFQKVMGASIVKPAMIAHTPLPPAGSQMTQSNLPSFKDTLEH